MLLPPACLYPLRSYWDCSPLLGFFLTREPGWNGGLCPTLGTEPTHAVEICVRFGGRGQCVDGPLVATVPQGCQPRSRMA